MAVEQDIGKIDRNGVMGDSGSSVAAMAGQDFAAVEGAPCVSLALVICGTSSCS